MGWVTHLLKISGDGCVAVIEGMSNAEGLFLAVVKAVGVRNRHMQKEKVDGGICEEGVAGDAEPVIVIGVLADITAFVAGRAGAAA